MQNQEKETYKDYLVRKVTEEIGKVFEAKMDQAKKELKEITSNPLSQMNMNELVQKSAESAMSKIAEQQFQGYMG